MSELDDSLPPTVLERWQAAWPKALAIWSKFTRLHDPLYCQTRVAAAKEGLTGSFAMIRFADQSVVIDLETIRAQGLEDYGLEILAHEIGHHVLAPGNMTDQLRLLARIRRGLPTLEKHAPLIANLYTDLLINDRLQRHGELRMVDVFQKLTHGDNVTGGTPPRGLWNLYLRIYENLWKLDAGTLANTQEDNALDAWLGSRVVRVYAKQYLDGAGRFASLVLPYLMKDLENARALASLHDTKDAGQGSEPNGFWDEDPDEIEGAIHPSEDPLITGDDEARQTAPVDINSGSKTRTSSSHGQAREPFGYGELLKASGIKLSDHDIAVRYYRERALPHLIAFPTRPSPESREPQLEGLEPWDIGDPHDELDWIQTVMQSPKVFPGLTTMRRHYGREPGRTPARIPVDLDMYVDSSGSMPNPLQRTSFLTLAGAIIALSALRAGSKVQVTLWSGKDQVTHTRGFVRDEDAILRVLTGFYGGATAFPIHRLRETYAHRRPTDRAAHLLMISDDGIDTMFEKDERGTSGWDVAAHALAVGRAGGTMALNLPQLGREVAKYFANSRSAIARAQREQGWVVEAVTDWEALVAFARNFSRRHYAEKRSEIEETVL
jgi:hypothetical protein